MLKKKLLLSILLLLSLSTFGQDSAHGKELYTSFCFPCHGVDMVDELIGPGLGGVGKRWASYPITDLFDFIRNSQSLIQSGHPRANELFDAYSYIDMPEYQHFTDGDIADILVYVDSIYQISLKEVPKEKEEEKGGALAHGEALFGANCLACHNKNMKDRLIGPALGGVQVRWVSYPQSDLYGFVRNSSKMIEAGHPKAQALMDKYQMPMPSFPSLTDREIGDIFYYIAVMYEKNKQ